MTAPSTRPVVAHKALGLSAIGGIVGFAVATNEHLERFESHRVRKGESDVTRLMAHLASLLGSHGCTALALVDTNGRHHPVWVSELARWCREVAELSGLAWYEADAIALRAEGVERPNQPSNWRLMASLAERYPALRAFTRSGFPPSVLRYQRQKRERYWAPAFLALAAAEQLLAKVITDEETSS